MNMLNETYNKRLDKYSNEAFSTVLYNSLQPIMDADKSRKARKNQDSLFEDIGELICEYNLELNVGVCLLHNHNLVADNHFMCERLDATSYPAEALVMEHIELSEASNVNVPVAFKVTNASGVAALEFSTVDLALENYQALVQQGETFIPRFCELVIKHDFQDLIGLSVLRSDVLKPKRNEILLEQSEHNRIANVVMVSDKPGASDHIQTIWQFERVWASPEGSTSETDAHTAGECKAANYCKSWCAPGADESHKPEHEQIVHVKDGAES